MTQYKSEVEKRRLYLAAEHWGNSVAQHYMCNGCGDLGYGTGYFIYYNNGAVHKINKKGYTIVQVAMSIDEVIDNYTRSEECGTEYM
jgi:glycerol kinase